MGVIADECPKCNRVTRCVVVEQSGVRWGGVFFGIPLVLPYHSSQCFCGECGCEFRSRFLFQARAVPPEQAAHLDTDALLDLTNPALKEAVAFAALRAVPRLGRAFQLLDQLRPGPLRAGLQAALGRWPDLGATAQDDLLGRVEVCSEALGFVRRMTGLHSAGSVGCLVGSIATAATWAGCALAFDRLGALGWGSVVLAGLAAGGVPCALIWQSQDRRFVRDVLLPEAERAGVRTGWVLAIVEGTAGSGRAEDELRRLRDLGPAIREELASSGHTVESDAGFG